MKYGLEEDTINKIQGVFSKFPEIEKAVIYGSRAKGNFRYNSDIDITLSGKNLSLTALSEIESEIDDLLLPYLFDISLFSSISNRDLIEHIERIGKVFYEKDSAG